jgi:hypothetical protein
MSVDPPRGNLINSALFEVERDLFPDVTRDCFELMQEVRPMTCTLPLTTFEKFKVSISPECGLNIYHEDTVR